MDTLQTQINVLNGKMDNLYQMTEQLNSNLAQVISEMKVSPSNTTMTRSALSMGGGRYSYSHPKSPDSSLEHKDVLVDNNSPDLSSQGGERTLSPEIQIQRLTAQLTAAYNRIAALEEQLLAQRIH